MSDGDSHYFKNKKCLYLYIFQYCVEVVEKLIIQNAEGDETDIFKLDDFFDRMEYGAKRKIVLMHTYPYILQFIMNAFYSRDEEISDDIVRQIRNILDPEYVLGFFKGIRYDKFKDDCDPVQIIKMLTWLMDGYMRERQYLNIPLDVEEMMKEFQLWKGMFRKMCYKEECI